MTRHLIQGHYGVGDRANLAPAGADEHPTRFDLVAYDKVLDFGIGGALTDLKAKSVFPTEIALDLLVIAAHVHAADTRISRATESDDAWTREIRIVVPVSDVVRWNMAVPVLERMLNFLTGDRWTIQFRPRPLHFAHIVPQASLIVPPFSEVSLFSGGLDSLIGAIDQLEAKEAPLLVSHAGEPAVSKAQDDCFELLQKHYPKSAFARLRIWIAFPKKLVDGVASEDSTRGRSFLFFALGVFAGAGLRRDFVMHAPENGLIALNVPLDKLRLGALSARHIPSTSRVGTICWVSSIFQADSKIRIGPRPRVRWCSNAPIPHSFSGLCPKRYPVPRPPRAAGKAMARNIAATACRA